MFTQRPLTVLITLFIAALLVAACDGAQQPTSPPETDAGTPADTFTQPPAGSIPDVPMSDLPPVYITTSSNSTVGVGSYVAAEVYSIAAGSDPVAQPAQAFIMPYAIYPNMKVTDINAFDPSAEAYRIRQAGFSSRWELTAPEGSRAALIDRDGIQVFLADLTGRYTLTVTTTDSAGSSGSDAWVVTAGTYVGVGPLDGSAVSPSCAACHQERAVDEWARTKHATMFTQAVDGKKSAHYAAECISCHTTGFNNRPEAAKNGGFFDIASQAGWKFPGTQTEGNWAAMSESFPQAAAMANIQCEACHGPGSEHVTSTGNTGPIGGGLEFGACAQCHAQEPYNVLPQQWQNSAHAAQTAEAFWRPIGEERSDCVRCHTGGGYVDYMSGHPQEQWRTDYSVISCSVCHDPHNSTHPFLVRAYDAISLPNGVAIEEPGSSATCMNCHNTRVDAVSAVEGDPVEVTSEEFAGMFQLAAIPHYSNATELMASTGGYTWGLTLPTTLHGQVVEGTCVGCHMAASPGMNTQGTDDTADDTPLPGHNTVGGHTFAMKDASGAENVVPCQECHNGATNFRIKAQGNYDGDEIVEISQIEVEGLLAILRAELEARGVIISPEHPYIVLPKDASVDLRGAAFNYKFVMGRLDGQTEPGKSAAMHNVGYTASLLQLSIEKLTGAPIPNADRP